MKRISSAEPYFPADDIEWILARVREILSSGVLTKGPHVKEFEAAFAALAGVRHAIAVSSGTQALELALRHYQLEGAEVIVPTNTFLASANAVLLAGGRPVLADIDPHTLSIGLAQIERQLTAKTRGVMIVHIGGTVCPEIEAIAELCKRRRLFLLEDASHAHGAERGGRRAGSFGDAAAFSLFPTKPMTTCEGGIITTNDDALAESARLFRNHGTAEGKTSNDTLGSNYRMDEIRAVLGVAQVGSLPGFLAERRRVAARYTQALEGVSGLSLLSPGSQASSSYYKFATVLSTAERRSEVARALLEAHGIETGSLYWPACHRQPIVRARPDLYAVRSPFVSADDVLPRVLCLPVSAKLDEATQDRVIAALKTELNRRTRPAPARATRPGLRPM